MLACVNFKDSFGAPSDTLLEQFTIFETDNYLNLLLLR